MSDIFHSLESWADLWGASIWRASWQGAIFIALAWAIARWCTFLSPRVVCWIWRLVCIKLLVGLLWIEPLAIPLLPALPPVPSTPGLIIETAPKKKPMQVAIPADESPRPVLMSTWFWALWSVGVFIRLMVSLGQWWKVRRLSAAGIVASSFLTEIGREESARLGVRRLPRLMLSSCVTTPLLAGIWRPTIVLPGNVETAFDEAEIRLMLGHELTHQMRRDLLWNWLPTSVGWLFFFHPLVWVMTRSWLEAQEAACDELLIQKEAARPAEFGRLLLKLATRWPAEPGPALATAGVLGAYRTLERRILAMTRVKPLSRKKLLFAATLLAALGTVAVVPWRLVADEKPADKNPSKLAEESPKKESRTKRQNRWNLLFRTNNGQEYLDQLQDLGVILATPAEGAKYTIYRDLQTRPVQGKEGEAPKDRIFWIDDKPESVKGLAAAMGLKSTPPWIAAFFPEKFENDLRKMEQDRYKGAEDDISETTFRIVSRDGHYVPVLADVKLLSPKLLNALGFYPPGLGGPFANPRSAKQQSEIEDAKAAVGAIQNHKEYDEILNKLKAAQEKLKREDAKKAGGALLSLRPEDVQETRNKILATLAKDNGYSLASGEYLRRVPPPFPAKRTELYRQGFGPRRDGFPRGPIMNVFQWNRQKLEFKSAHVAGGPDWETLANDGESLKAILSSLGVQLQRIEGNDQILDQKIPGDWVIRSGTTNDQVVKQLDAILRKELSLLIRMEFREVKRQVYVMEGTYRFTPVPGEEKTTNEIQVYSQELIPNSGAGGGSGTFTEFLNALSNWISTPLVSEIKTPPAGKVAWSFHARGEFTKEMFAEDREPAAVLANITAQTGLTFRKDEKPIRVLFVEPEK